MYIDLARGVPALHPERKGMLDWSPKKNWVDKAGGLPAYINSVATAMMRDKGYAREKAIRTAVNWAKNVCATGTTFGGKVKVSSAVQSAACAAVKAWESKKARGRKDLTDREEKLTDSEYLALVGYELTEFTDEELELPEDIDFEALLPEEGDTEMKLQMPLDFSEGTKVGRKLWRKQILPKGQIHYNGNILDFNDEFAQQLVKNFNEGPFTQVPLVLADAENRHNESPTNYIGEVKGLELTDNGIEAIVETTDQGTELLTNNPKLGTSPRLLMDYVRAADQKEFGPVIRHLAATMYPHVPNLESWSDLADKTEGAIVDLTDYEVSKGGDMETKTKEEVVETKVETVDLTEEQKDLLDNAKKAVDLAEKLKSDLDAERQARIAEAEARRQDRIEAELLDLTNQGVPKPVIDLARPLLVGKEAKEDKVVDLTEDMREDKIRELLKNYVNFVPRGEEGTVDLTDADEDDEAIKQYRELFGE